VILKDDLSGQQTPRANRGLYESFLGQSTASKNQVETNKIIAEDVPKIKLVSQPSKNPH
jgi:hypothetical protein